MSKKITYELNYRIKGEKKVKKIDIDFIPNQRYKDWESLNSDLQVFGIKWNHIKALNEEFIILLRDKKANIEAIKEFKEEIEKLTEELKYAKDLRIYERRFELVQNILIDNGYSGDKELMSLEFWDNCVEISVIHEFLIVCLEKDIDKKKVVH